MSRRACATCIWPRGGGWCNGLSSQHPTLYIASTLYRMYRIEKPYSECAALIWCNHWMLEGIKFLAYLSYSDISNYYKHGLRNISRPQCRYVRSGSALGFCSRVDVGDPKIFAKELRCVVSSKNCWTVELSRSHLKNKSFCSTVR